ncbi:CHAT domain-containing protein [Nodosilinea sp. LEGE 07088]|uniref:CHAT domain-containing protein n=1 Tax=Nodosilinea sp. LEGE 07088 TaxID=2777968 RepID=UPI0019E1E123|nr:CHAT domain-containing protein [Nodosilinea sp. LEGE 07088]MBE9139133.1 CHAT domain-containing protein [Nodosilinea sp. LEGE 07088]
MRPTRWRFNNRQFARWRSRGGYGLLIAAIALLCFFRSPVQALVSPVTIPATWIAQDGWISETEAQRLERAGQGHYAAGEFQEAALSFQQAAQAYAAQGDPVRQAINLANLSLTYQGMGQWAAANQAIDQSLALLPLDTDIARSAVGQSALAQVWDIEGHLQLAEGKPEQALATWEKTADLYEQLSNSRRWATSLINQAQALRQLGLYQRAEVVLQKVVQPPSLGVLLLGELGGDPLSELERRLLLLPVEAATANALRSLGETLQIAGDLEQAQALVHHSLRLAEDLGQEDAIARAHLSLGNLIQTQALDQLRAQNLSPAATLSQLRQERDLIETVLDWRLLETARRFAQQLDAALDHYQNAARGTPTTAVQAQLNQLQLFLITHQWTDAESSAKTALPLLEALPPAPATQAAYINLADSLMTLAQESQGNQSNGWRSTADRLLGTAHQQAIALGDPRAESYALGMLGTLYEQSQRYAEAEVATNRALQTIRSSTAEIAQNVNDAEVIYRWHWQMGRIHRAQGDYEAAIAAYNSAIETLTQLRRDIVTSNLPYRFSFRNSVEEPVYIECLDLLLASASPSQEKLTRSREIVSLLNQAELTNFLQEPCEAVTPQQTDRVVDTAQTTAVFYPILLPDRLDVILKLPQRSTLLHYSSAIAQDELAQTIETLQRDLEEDYTFKAVEENAQKLYDWIVAPAQPELDTGIDTFVFALTGALQTIPMAVLYDGERYLIERVAVAEILGLQLENPAPLELDSINILAAGLAEVPESLPESIRVKFAPIPNVVDELGVIEALALPAKTISGESFTQQNFNALMNTEQFSTIHLATHGQFSSNPQDTFLLVSPSGDNSGKIAASDLALLFRVRGRIQPEPLELLVLSACETAAGDELATLGIAGTAYRAGARSVIASLWTLDDAPTVGFAAHFYQNLGQPAVSKAKALQHAQLALLKTPRFAHPRYWATYVLAGNWL